MTTADEIAELSRDIRRIAACSVLTFLTGLLAVVVAAAAGDDTKLRWFAAVCAGALTMMFATFVWILAWLVIQHVRTHRELAAIKASWHAR